MPLNYLNELPRHLPGGPPSARTFNATADEVDALGLSLTVARTNELYAAYIGRFVDTVVQWQTALSGTGTTAGGYAMWSPGQPQFVRIHTAGVYLMLLQVRFANRNGYDQNILATGRRYATILVNGTSTASDAIATRSRIALPPPGPTVQTWAVKPLQPGDTIWCSIRSTHNNTETTTNASIYAMDPDLGGTFLTVSRVGPAWQAVDPFAALAG